MHLTVLALLAEDSKILTSHKRERERCHLPIPLYPAPATRGPELRRLLDRDAIPHPPIYRDVTLMHAALTSCLRSNDPAALRIVARSTGSM